MPSLFKGNIHNSKSKLQHIDSYGLYYVKQLCKINHIQVDKTKDSLP